MKEENSLHQLQIKLENGKEDNYTGEQSEQKSFFGLVAF